MRYIPCPYSAYTIAQEASFDVLGFVSLLLILLGVLTGIVALHGLTRIANKNTSRKWLLFFGVSVPLGLFHFAKLMEYQVFSLWHQECRTAGDIYEWYVVHIFGACCFILFHSIIFLMHRKINKKSLPSFFRGLCGET